VFQRIFGRKNTGDNEQYSALVLDTNISNILQDVVDTIVYGLSFRAAILALVEPHDEETDRLSVKAFCTDLKLVSNTRFRDVIGKGLLEAGELIAGKKLINNYVLMSDPDNKAVAAIRNNNEFVLPENLFEVFRPVIDRDTADRLQDLAGIKSLISVPFRNRAGRLIGNLYAGSEKESIDLSKRQQLVVFSKMATLAVDNAVQRVQKARATDREDFLKEIITQLLSVTLNEKNLWETIVGSVVEKLGFRMCLLAVIRHQQDDPTLSVIAHEFSRNVDRLPFSDQRQIDKTLLNQTIAVNKETAAVNIAVKSILEEEEFTRTEKLLDLFAPLMDSANASIIQANLGVSEIVVVPLRNRDDELVGSLYAGTNRSRITDEEIGELKTVALAAAIAMENAASMRESKRMGLFASGVGNLAHHVNHILYKVTREVDDMYLEMQKLRTQYAGNSQSQEISSLLTKIGEAAEHLNQVAERINQSNELIRSVRNRISQDIGQSGIRVWTVQERISRAWESLANPDGYDGYVRPADIKFTMESSLGRRDIKVEASQELSEVFRILMKNACEAMGETGSVRVMIDVKASQKESHSRDVQITIADTGPGIPQEKRENLFHLKNQSSKPGGLGYGLWAAQYTVQLFGGEIDCQTHIVGEESENPYLSGQSSGTAFIITLPMLDSEE
jgi:signal transduction histidine kinase